LQDSTLRDCFAARHQVSSQQATANCTAEEVNSSSWKVQEKFNVTWNNFIKGVEVTDIMKCEQSASQLSITLLISNHTSQWQGETIS
jgi:hypothetical protein